MVRFLSILLLLAFSGLSQGQQLNVVKIADDSFVVFEIDAAGAYKFIGSYKSFVVIGAPTPDPPTPPAPNAWNVTGGLHLIVVDNENERGKLPQSQVNIFTSVPLRQWLDSNTARGADGRPAYRFSSNDSLVVGGEARKQELPVYVEGWDLLLKSGVKLPAWIVSNGRRTVVEPLPATVDAAISRLGGLK
jgi:hypothetical protein